MFQFTQLTKKIIYPAFLVSLVCTDLVAQQTTSAAKSAITQSVGEKSEAEISISGVIREASTRKPLPGINISIEGFSAAISDDSGLFKISAPRDNAVILVSGPGYQSKEVALKKRRNLNIELYEDSYTSLYDVALVSNGVKRKSQIPNSISSINTHGNWDKHTETPDAYLQGRVAGLEVIRRSGTPGIGADLYIRGFNSLYATNKPLIVVDGMIYDTNNYGSSLITGFATNKFAQIELKDIDQITVLKDGTSMYGTRGGNGVILITTGRAKDEATRLDFAAYGGVNSSVSSIPVMDSDRYRVYLSDILSTKAGMNPGEIQGMPFLSDQTSTEYYNYHQQTNWQNAVMNEGYSQNYHLKVTGGDNIATYALSLGYLKNEGLIAETDLTRYQTRFNANLNLSQKLKVQANIAFTRSEQNLRDQGLAMSTNPLYLALVKSPFLSSHVLSETGIPSPNLSPVDMFSISNPVAATDGITALNRSYRFVGAIGFDYSFSNTLGLHSMMGVTYDKVRENTFVPSLGIAPLTLSTAEAVNRAGANIQRNYTLFNNTWLSYMRKFGQSHSLSANLGFRYSSSSAESDYGLSYNTASDEFVTLQSGVSSLRVVNGGLGKWNWLNTYLNVDYNALDKYFLTFNVAADASSRFGKEIPNALTLSGNKYAVLPGVSAAWLISSENFMSNFSAIELLKFRLGYGLSGNDDIGNYAAKKYYVSQNFLGKYGTVRGNIGNPELKWETVAKANAGLDISFFKERLSFSVDAYQSKTSDMLILKSITSASGLMTSLTNSGEMKTKGIEFSANGRIINKSSLKWDLGINLSSYKNEVTQLPGTIYTSYAGATMITEVGQSANLFYGYKTNGVYSTSQEAASSGLSNKLADGSLVPVQAGDIRFVNINGDNVITEADKQVIGDPTPDFTGAVFNQFVYKRWSLNALLTFSKGNDVFNGTRASLESLAGAENQTMAAVNRWRTEGQVTNTPRAVWGDPTENSRFSDRWIEDGSYLRLKTVTLAYNLPKISFLKNATVYATGNNIFTITRYLGYDPEFNVSENIFARGIDTFYEPQFRSLQLGIRVGL